MLNDDESKGKLLYWAYEFSRAQLSNSDPRLELQGAVRLIMGWMERGPEKAVESMTADEIRGRVDATEQMYVQLDRAHSAYVMAGLTEQVEHTTRRTRQEREINRENAKRPRKKAVTKAALLQFMSDYELQHGRPCSKKTVCLEFSISTKTLNDRLAE